MANKTHQIAGCVLAGAEFDRSALTEVELTTGTVLGSGDLVKLNGATSTDANFPRVARISGSDDVYGIFINKVNVTHEDTQGYYDGVAAARGLIYVIRPGDEFFMQEDAVSSTLSTADIGKGIDIIVANANSTTGKSNMKLDSSTAATGAARQAVILGLSREVDQETGDAYSKWRIRFMENQIDDSFQGVTS